MTSRQDLQTSAWPPVDDGQPRRRNGLAITALVIGIVAFVVSIPAMFTFLHPGLWIEIILGVPAVVFGGLALIRARRDRASNKWMAILGLVAGIVAVGVGTYSVLLDVRLTNECLAEESADIAQSNESFGENVTDDLVSTCIERKIYP